MPTVAVAASCSTSSRVLPKLICVENPLTAPVTCQVGGALPSHSPGRPVGPTGGDVPQACAERARAARTAAARTPTAMTRFTRASLPGRRAPQAIGATGDLPAEICPASIAPGMLCVKRTAARRPPMTIL